MTSDSLPLRVTRLENDTVAIYELLTEVKETQAVHTAMLAQHDARFDRVDDQFDRVDNRFDRVDDRFDQIDDRFDEVLRRLPDHG